MITSVSTWNFNTNINDSFLYSYCRFRDNINDSFLYSYCRFRDYLKTTNVNLGAERREIEREKMDIRLSESTVKVDKVEAFFKSDSILSEVKKAMEKEHSRSHEVCCRDVSPCAS